MTEEQDPRASQLGVTALSTNALKSKPGKPKFWDPGDVIVGTDGKQYQVQSDGSWRRMLALATKEEIAKLKAAAAIGGKS